MPSHPNTRSASTSGDVRAKGLPAEDRHLTQDPETTQICVHPHDLSSLFAKRPLILGEAEADYDELLSKVTVAVRPANAIEAMLVKDVVDLMWESQRFRRLKTSLLMTAAKSALIRLLCTLKDLDTGRPLAPESAELQAVCCLQGEEESVEEVKEILSDHGLDLDSVMAQALSDQLHKVEVIDRMIAAADARRSKALTEIERSRDALARRLRTVAEDVGAVHSSPDG
jgi:hypothetical protein